MPSVFLNTIYVQSIPGILKFACLLLLFLGFLLVQVSSLWNGYASFFNFVVILEFMCTLLLFLLYLFNVPVVYIGVPWLNIEFFYCVAAAGLLGLASLLLAIKGTSLLIFAAIIGFLAMFLYGYDALSKYREYTSGQTTGQPSGPTDVVA